MEPLVVKESKALLHKATTRLFVKDDPITAKVIDFDFLRLGLVTSQNYSNNWSTLSKPEYFAFINTTME